MEEIQHGWDTPLNTFTPIAPAFAIEFDPGFTTVFASSETLCRMMVLYQECGVKCSPTMFLLDTDEGQEELRLLSLLIEEPLSNLDVEHEQMRYLKEYSVAMWQWKIVVNESPDEHWELLHDGIPYSGVPVLAVRFAGYDKAWIFGQSNDLSLVSSVMESAGLAHRKIRDSASQTISLEISDTEFSDMVILLRQTDYPLLVRDWISD